jgi:hypothetical protein
LAFLGVGIVKVVDPGAIPQEVKPLSDYSPVTVAIEIQRPADVVWPALLEAFPGRQKRRILIPGRREIHIGGGSKVILDQLENGTSLVSYTIKPMTRWGDGSFGYKSRPGMYNALERVKHKVGDYSPLVMR